MTLMGATGVGSWPGTAMHQALAVVRGELGDLPHLPELPDRGPAGALVGRTAARLVDLPVDLQPHGWRLVDRPGMDLTRAQAFWREDLDRLAQTFDGWDGPLKVQLAGPWTLAASLWLPRGERVLVDPGARRDIIGSLAQTVAELIADVQRLLPSVQVVLQLDEPALPAVLQGRLPTASGYGTLRAIDPAQVRGGLQMVLAAVPEPVRTAVHCCAAQVPLALLREAGAQALSVDVSLLGRAGWESVAASVEAGVQLWAGVVPTAGAVPPTTDLAGRVARPWTDVGLAPAGLAEVVVTPTCGLAGGSPAAARAALVRAGEVAQELTAVAVG